jgi:arginine deiminase
MQTVIDMLNVFSLQMYAIGKLLIGMYMRGLSKSDEEKYSEFEKPNYKGDESNRPLANV